VSVWENEKNKTNVERADSEIRRAWVEFSVTREKKKRGENDYGDGVSVDWKTAGR